MQTSTIPGSSPHILGYCSIARSAQAEDSVAEPMPEFLTIPDAEAESMPESVPIPDAVPESIPESVPFEDTVIEEDSFVAIWLKLFLFLEIVNLHMLLGGPLGAAQPIEMFPQNQILGGGSQRPPASGSRSVEVGGPGGKRHFGPTVFQTLL